MHAYHVPRVRLHLVPRIPARVSGGRDIRRRHFSFSAGGLGPAREGVVVPVGYWRPAKDGLRCVYAAARLRVCAIGVAVGVGKRVWRRIAPPIRAREDVKKPATVRGVVLRHVLCEPLPVELDAGQRALALRERRLWRGLAPLSSSPSLCRMLRRRRCRCAGRIDSRRSAREDWGYGAMMMRQGSMMIESGRCLQRTRWMS
ncbi:hypothetical protein OH76DRAFT_768209 [Lentinus brumalis]|uniref:Uncharacterized protein n=1 Tax=Lentinus brumalis TaxID=2498619 RepID=A0A371D4M6_9APHY|nr:hypothetical protein OH76DRAFT_768209 [Polyporus brumalis]